MGQADENADEEAGDDTRWDGGGTAFKGPGRNIIYELLTDVSHALLEDDGGVVDSAVEDVDSCHEGGGQNQAAGSCSPALLDVLPEDLLVVFSLL